MTTIPDPFNTIRRCSVCLMDNTDPDIIIYGESGCNHCRELSKALTINDSKRGELDAIISNIRRDQAASAYDCIVGLSGGIDSAYVAFIATRLGLRVLCVHVDNGWNSEIANENIRKITLKLKLDLKTVVLDWEQFRNAQLAFFRSSTPDLDIVTDHAIRTVLLRIARKYNIKYLLNGRNFSTEGILPSLWSYNALDSFYIRSVCHHHGALNLNRIPISNFIEFLYNIFVSKLENICILNLVPYSKNSAQKTLKELCDWSDYGGKHYESRFTRFIQGYILPKKFSYDKRKAHLSVLVVNRVITREQGLKILQTPPLPPVTLESEINYFCKKLQITRDLFEQIMSEAPRSYKNYPNMSWFYLADNRSLLAKILKLFKQIKLVPNHFASAFLGE